MISTLDQRSTGTRVQPSCGADLVLLGLEPAAGGAAVRAEVRAGAVMAPTAASTHGTGLPFAGAAAQLAPLFRDLTDAVDAVLPPPRGAPV